MWNLTARNQAYRQTKLRQVNVATGHPYDDAERPEIGNAARREN
jgi:hypothetical protein